MDIRSFTRKDTTTVKIKNPLGIKTDASVEVYGTDSDQYKKARIELARDFDSNDDESAMRKGATLIQSCIKSWENITDEGLPIDPHSKDAFAILVDPEFDYFVSQISNAMHNRSLFFSKSVKS